MSASCRNLRLLKRLERRDFSKNNCEKIIFLYILYHFNVFILKLIFLKKLNIILLHFNIKNTLKINCNHIL